MARNRSVMKHQFSQVPKATIPRSSFNRSCGYKTTFNAGPLIPVFCDEVLPGDTFNLKATLFGRMATPLKPIMDNLFLETFFFFVPNRLVWSNWERFNGQQTDPSDSTDYVIPTQTPPAGGWTEGSFFDYMGLPVGVENISVSALPQRGYTLIYNEWFRDQNLINSATLDTGDVINQVSSGPLRFRGKRHDYFTSCLPWPQKGDPVRVPLGDLAPIVSSLGTNDSDPVYTGSLDEPLNRRSMQTNEAPGGLLWGSDINPGLEDINMFADISQATGVSINELRQSFQIQKLLERDARGGTRYTEIIRSHFGVTSPDARLQRPEFLGGGTSMININPVPQTSDQISGGPGAETPQGNLAAFGTVTANNHGFVKSFTEHGHIIGIVNVRADLTYQQGINRLWSRQTRYDYYWPALAHIGEQAVLNKEIYAQGTEVDEDVFGYQERSAEYRYKPSMITGKFRSSDPQTLDFWHLSQEFEDLPVLGTVFITENPPIERVIAVETEPHFLLDAYFNLKCVRPMPLYGVPGLIDHF